MLRCHALFGFLAFLGPLAAGTRQLVLAVAFLATLTTAFGVHLHWAAAGHHADAGGGTCAAAGHQHGGQQVVSKFSGDSAGLQGDDQGNALADPDGCGHCHCQMPSTGLPSQAPALGGAGFTVVAHRPQDAVAPDDLAFTPDPPPAKS